MARMEQRLRFPTLVTATLLPLALVGCNTDASKAKAEVSAPAALSPNAAPAGAARYTFSAADSKLGFVGAKVTLKHECSFTGFSGKIDMVGSDPTKSSLVVDVDMATATTDSNKLTGHLKSPDFFDVAKFPSAKFSSTSIKAGGDGKPYTITGNLKLHGVTKSISFPATLKIADGNVDAQAEFSLNRKDFGIVYPGMPDDLIQDNVVIKLDVHAKKASA